MQDISTLLIQDVHEFDQKHFFFQKGKAPIDVGHIRALLDNPFVVMTYKEALDVLEKNSEKVSGL